MFSRRRFFWVLSLVYSSYGHVFGLNKLVNYWHGHVFELVKLVNYWHGFPSEQAWKTLMVSLFFDSRLIGGHH